MNPFRKCPQCSRNYRLPQVICGLCKYDSRKKDLGQLGVSKINQVAERKL